MAVYVDQIADWYIKWQIYVDQMTDYVDQMADVGDFYDTSRELGDLARSQIGRLCGENCRRGRKNGRRCGENDRRCGKNCRLKDSGPGPWGRPNSSGTIWASKKNRDAVRKRPHGRAEGQPVRSNWGRTDEFAPGSVDLGLNWGGVLRTGGP